MISRRNLFSMVAGAAAAVPAVAFGGAVKPIPSLDVGGYRLAPGMAPLNVGEIVVPATAVQAFFAGAAE